MAAVESSKVGKRGTVVIPARLRRQFGIEEGTLVIAEACKEGILLRRATKQAVETYTPQRRAEFLLSNAVDAKDYARACEEVHKLGLDPAKIRHRLTIKARTYAMAVNAYSDGVRAVLLTNLPSLGQNPREQSDGTFLIDLQSPSGSRFWISTGRQTPLSLRHSVGS